MPTSGPAARSATGRTRKPLSWVPWAALLILAALVALIWIIVANNTDEDDDTVGAPSPAAATVGPVIFAA